MLIELLVASSLAVTGFARAGTFLLKSPVGHDEPNDVADWLRADDAAQTCVRINASWLNRAADPRGEYVEDVRGGGRHFLEFQTGTHYWYNFDEQAWKVLGTGAWIAKTTTWKQDGHRRLWLGEGLQAFNDPRPQFATRWYVFGANRICHVFHEKSRSYDAALDLQTVELDSGVSGLPAWTLQTGRATLGTLTEAGNWLDL